MRTQPQTGENYHVYNRGTDKRDIFLEQEDLDRFMLSMTEFNTTEPIGSLFEARYSRSRRLGDPITKSGANLVEFITFSLLPNHFHLVMKQLVDGGIPKFMQKLGNGYTRFFNEKYERSGVLFQGKYKSKHIQTNEYLLTVSAYTNLNHKIHSLGDPITKWGLCRTSFGEYMGDVPKRICATDIVASQFRDKKSYRIFCEETVKIIIEGRKREEYFD